MTSKSKRRIGALRKIALSSAACLFIAILYLSPSRAVTLPESSDILSVVPGSSSYSRELRPLDYYKMTGSSGRVVGAAFITSLIPPEVAGYRDEIDVLVGIDMTGKITGIKLLGYKESPDFMERIVRSGFFKRFIGKKAGDSFADIETITGATISSQAIIDDIRTASAEVAKQIVASKTLKSSESIKSDAWTWVGTAAMLFIIFMALASAFMPRQRRLRMIVLILSIPVIGFWLNSPVTIGDLVDLRNLRLPGFSRLPHIVLLMFALVIPFVRGNLYCFYLCPFGAIQELFSKVKTPKCLPDSKSDRAMSWMRWVIAIAVIYSIAALGSATMRTVEPFSRCFSFYPDFYILTQAAVVLFLALFVRRIWCRYFCPTGLVLDLLALAGSKIRHIIAELARRQNAGKTPS